MYGLKYEKYNFQRFTLFIYIFEKIHIHYINVKNLLNKHSLPITLALAHSHYHQLYFYFKNNFE